MSEEKKQKTRPRANSFDVSIGRKLRDRRNVLHLSQDDLAKLVGVSYQQVQKYEAGTNRISASMLYHIARCLDVGVEYFLLDAPDFDVVPKAAPCLAALDSAIEGVERLQEELKGARTTFRKSRRQIEQGSGARRYRDFLTD